MCAFDPVTNEYEPEETYCEVCGAELEREDCGRCGGDGFVEHIPDAEEPWTGFELCYECCGHGGWDVCPHAGEAQHMREKAVR